MTAKSERAAEWDADREARGVMASREAAPLLHGLIDYAWERLNETLETRSRERIYRVLGRLVARRTELSGEEFDTLRREINGR